MKKILLVTGLSVLSILSYSQNASLDRDTLTWTVSEYYNLVNNETIKQKTEFVTFGLGYINWLQDDGRKVYKFAVKNMQSSWTDLNSDGQAIFHVSLNDFYGELKFQRVNGVLKVLFDFQKDGQNVMPYVFFVSNLTKN